MLHLISLTLFGIFLIVGLGALPPSFIRPNLTLIIAVYMGQFYPPVSGLILSFFFGYFMDTVSGGLLGLNAFSMVSAYYLSFILSKRMLVQDIVTQVLMVFSFYIVYEGIIYMLFRFFNFEVTGYTYIKTAMYEGSAAAVLSIPVISSIRRMERFFRFENERAAGSEDTKV